MTETTITTETINVSVPPGFLSSVLDYERAGITRQAIMALVAPELKAIDEGRKATRDSIVKQIKSLGAIDGANVANVLCASERGADEAGRQRLKRRRDFMVATLCRTFQDYTFTKDSGHIIAEYIGDSATRQAKELLTSLATLIDLELLGPASKSLSRLTVEEVAETIRSSQAATTGESVGEMARQQVPAKYLAAIAARVAVPADKAGVAKVSQA
jgi:hypothetical protein